MRDTSGEGIGFLGREWGGGTGIPLLYWSNLGIAILDWFQSESNASW